jgi:hypothetical protein
MSPEKIVRDAPSFELIGYWCGDRKAFAAAHRSQRYWNEEEASWWIHPKYLVDDNWESVDRPAIVAYLRNASVCAHYRGLSYCRFGCGWNGSQEQTDGTWRWPEGLAHYVEQHAVTLPDEFVAHMRAHGFVPPNQATVYVGAGRSLRFWERFCRQEIEKHLPK